MPKKHSYNIRYSVEKWNKEPLPADMGEVLGPGVAKSTGNVGYTDTLFMVSIIKETGKPDTALILDSDTSSLVPAKANLIFVRDLINHYLESGHFTDTAPKGA